MSEILNVQIKNGEDISFEFIQTCEKSAEAALKPFKERLIQNNLKVELHIYKVENDFVRQRFFYPGLWNQELLDEVAAALDASDR